MTEELQPPLDDAAQEATPPKGPKQRAADGERSRKSRDQQPPARKSREATERPRKSREATERPRKKRDTDARTRKTRDKNRPNADDAATETP